MPVRVTHAVDRDADNLLTGYVTVGIVWYGQDDAHGGLVKYELSRIFSTREIEQEPERVAHALVEMLLDVKGGPARPHGEL